jgi:predicted Fe-S protein YdhL (DUF1289 family)
MFYSISPTLRPILTPCIGVCELDGAGFCRGCHRTRDEIARWSELSDVERARIMNDALPLRGAERGTT